MKITSFKGVVVLCILCRNLEYRAVVLPNFARVVEGSRTVHLFALDQRLLEYAKIEIVSAV